MRWIKLDVDYFAHPKALIAGRDGRDLHLASLCWMGRYLKDGAIPPEAVPEIARMAGLDTRHAVNALDRVTAAGLWIPNGGEGYQLHDFTAVNGTREDYERAAEQARARQRRHYQRSRQQNGDQG